MAGRIPAGLALPANKVIKVLKVLNDLKDPKDLKVICWQSQTDTPDGGRHWNCVVAADHSLRIGITPDVKRYRRDAKFCVSTVAFRYDVIT